MRGWGTVLAMIVLCGAALFLRGVAPIPPNARPASGAWSAKSRASHAKYAARVAAASHAYGRVVDEQGRPIAGAIVVLYEGAPRAAAARNDAVRIASSTTDEEGRFAFDHRAVRVFVEASTDMRPRVRSDVRHRAAEPIEFRDIILDPPEPAVDGRVCAARRSVYERGIADSAWRASDVVTGYVVDAVGTGLAGISVGARPVSPADAPFSEGTISIAGGCFALSGLRDAVYEVCAAAHQGSTEAPVRARPGDDIRLTLRPFGRIEGVVLDASGLRPKHHLVRLWLERSGQLTFVRYAELGPIPGEFRLFHLLPGRFVLEARDGDGREVWSDSIEVRLGDVVDEVELRLPAAPAPRRPPEGRSGAW